MIRILLSGQACLALLLLCHDCTAAERVALVIGNSTYQGDAVLRNPANDADAVAAALQELGFAVIKKKDVNVTQFESALAEFNKALTRGGLGLVYYAGHGLQVSGNNYLIPIGATVNDESHVRRQCVDVDDILGLLGQSQIGTKVLVLDCCRNNPFRRSWTRGTSDRGLARIDDIPDGTLIAFASSPGKTAADGQGRNSPFAEQLVAALKSRPETGLELRDAFQIAANAVYRATGKIQNPWIHNDGGYERYVLWSKSSSRPVETTQPSKTTPVDSVRPRVDGEAGGLPAFELNERRELVYVDKRGTKLWSKNVPEGFAAFSACDTPPIVVAMTLSGQILAYQIRTGQRVWQHAAPQPGLVVQECQLDVFTPTNRSAMILSYGAFQRQSSAPFTVKTALDIQTGRVRKDEIPQDWLAQFVGPVPPAPDAAPAAPFEVPAPPAP